MKQLSTCSLSASHRGPVQVSYTQVMLIPSYGSIALWEKKQQQDKVAICPCFLSSKSLRHHLTASRS